MLDAYVEMEETDCRTAENILQDWRKQTAEPQACQVRDDSSANQVINVEGR